MSGRSGRGNGRRRRPWLLAAIVITPAPLTDVQQSELLGARDGLDHHDSACRALVENLRDWSVSPGDLPAGEAAAAETDGGEGTLESFPELTDELAETLLADPDGHRGMIVRLEGRLEQASVRDSTSGPLDEWFVRLDGGRPALVLLASREPLALSSAGVGERGSGNEGGINLPTPGDHVTILGRWWKPISAEARDLRVRTYPAFVGRWIASGDEATGTSDASTSSISATSRIALMGGVLVILVLLLAGVTIGARMLRRKGVAGAGRLGSPYLGESAMMDHEDDGGLPDDAAEALSALRRRH